ncbi:MAG: hypothetical protein IPN67_21065 [Bacteroidales bacterium]|nr:hypothetical protein [Bacteroidales bacterium]
MKNVISLLILNTLVVLSIQAQPVSNYVYKLTNGITIKTEHSWSQVWVQQSYTPMNEGDKTSPLTVNIRALGDLIAGSEFKLLSAGKEVKMQGAAPGTYDLQLNFKLSGKPGTLGFVAGNIIIKPKTKTNVSIILYDYQILIDESQTALGGLSQYESLVNRCKSHTIQDAYFGIPTFYEKGNHANVIKPDQVSGNTKGKIKAGTYDLLLSIGIANQNHKVWLENFQLKPDVSYKVSVNLNAGGIAYTGGNPDVREMHMYPAGTAGKQTGKPEPIKTLETISYNNVTVANCCSPGTYDVLLHFAKGSKYEWRKNIAISTGVRTEVK